MRDEKKAVLLIGDGGASGRRAAILQSVREGYAGIIHPLGIVDRRAYPKALPIPANTTLKVPPPKETESGRYHGRGMIQAFGVRSRPLFGVAARFARQRLEASGAPDKENGDGNRS